MNKEATGDPLVGARDRRWLELLLDVALIANTADSLDSALTAALSKVVDGSDWYTGYARTLGHCRDLWWSEGSGAGAPEDMSSEIRELVERWAEQVMEVGHTQVITDFAAAADADFDLPGVSPRSGGAIATPLLVGVKAVGAMVFLSHHELDRHPEPGYLENLLRIIDSIGTQMGRIVERWTLLRRLVDEGERERETLARQVHDGLAQQLVGINLLARNLDRERQGADGDDNEQWDLLLESLGDALVEARGLARQLSADVLSGDTDTLVLQLEHLAQTVEAGHETTCRFESEDVEHLDMDDITRSQLVRIAREAVYNALRHADADRITIRLAGEPDGLVLEVRDDGSGLPAHIDRSPGIGLTSMRYRAGIVGAELELDSESAAGTTVRCTLPPN